MRRGIYYKLHVYDSEGNPLSPKSLEKQLDWIIKNADEHLGKHMVCTRRILTQCKGNIDFCTYVFVVEHGHIVQSIDNLFPSYDYSAIPIPNEGYLIQNFSEPQ